MDNPWRVPCFDHFLFFHCPECDYQSCDERLFYEHAVGTHVQASSTFETEEPKSVESLTLKDFHERFNPSLKSDFHTEETISDHEDNRIDDLCDNQDNPIHGLGDQQDNHIDDTSDHDLEEQETEIESKIFKCYKCKVGFEAKEDLHSHFRNDHKNEHPCLDCYNFFGNSTNELLTHQRKVKSNQVKCTGLSQYIKDHTESLTNADNQCFPCGIGFKSFEELKIHTKCLHRGPKFNVCCSGCLAGFPLERVTANVDATEKHCKSRNEKKQDKLHLNAHVVYQCDYCKDIFDSKEEFFKHRKDVHDLKPQAKSKPTFKCNECSSEFESRVNLQTHLQENHMKKVYEVTRDEHIEASLAKKPKLMLDSKKEKGPPSCLCPTCGTQFNTLTSYISHCLDNHNEVILCAFCNNHHHDEAQFQLHLNLEHWEELHRRVLPIGEMSNDAILCSICKVPFGEDKKKYPDLLHHFQIHHDNDEGTKPNLALNDNQPYCLTCVKPFETEFDLSEHFVKAHMVAPEDANFQCSACPFQTDNRADIQDHISRHSQDQLYPCEHCEINFAGLNFLTRHYTEEHRYLKYYYCDQCDLKFAEFPFKSSFAVKNSEIRKHMIEKHGIDSPSVRGLTVLKCHHCFQKFTESGPYERHILTAHETEEYLCPECGKLLKNGLERKAHMRAHEIRQSEKYKCDICGKVFPNKHRLLNHVNGSHTKAKYYSCDQCEMKTLYKSVLGSHVRRVHKGDKRKICDYCPEAFFDTRDKNKHMQKVHGKELSN